jgi:hypothetical protein
MAVHVKAIWRRSANAAEDVAMAGFDLDGPDVDVATKATLGALWVTWWNAIRERFPPIVVFDHLRFYNGYNGDGSPGQVDFTHAVNIAGLQSGDVLPPQCACSVTEELFEPDLRRHWGRFYLPQMGTVYVDENGRFEAGTVIDIADATRDLYNALRTAGWMPIVWVSAAGGGMAEVDGIRVDDIVDIQRRRRWDTFVTRQTRTLT